jgi:hypothetical protein
MRVRSLYIVASLSMLGAVASAAPIIYHVTVNTSSLVTTAGSLDFNFNPGPSGSQAASLQILNFTSNGTLAGACPCSVGDVSGLLPITVTFDNGSSFNDYFDDFTFGTTISFDVSLYGPALSTPDGFSTSGSTFAFSMFSNPAGTVPVLTSDTTDGFAFIANVNLDGTTNISDFSAATVVSPGTGMSPVPEPSYVALMTMGSVLMMTSRLFRRIDSNRFSREKPLHALLFDSLAEA